MKRFLFLSLFVMMQGLCGAALETLVNKFIAGGGQEKIAIIHNVLLKSIHKEVQVSLFYKVWLDSLVNRKRLIIVRQNLYEACREMGIDFPPEDWKNHAVDVSSFLVRMDLRERPGTIAHLKENNKMPSVGPYGLLDISGQGLTVCDTWNIDDKKEVKMLDVSRNNITALSCEGFEGFDATWNIDLSHNKLETLYVYVFAGLPEVRALYLNNNKLKHVSRGAFVGLDNVNNLFLDGNSVDLIGDSYDLSITKAKHPEWFSLLLPS